MKTLEWNGEYWYANHDPVWVRILLRVFWPGGWVRWDRGLHRHVWHVRHWLPVPWSLFGHRFTAYPWGWELKIGQGYLVWARSDGGGRTPRVYWSPNGTPGDATVWFRGTPLEIQQAAADARAGG